MQTNDNLKGHGGFLDVSRVLFMKYANIRIEEKIKQKELKNKKYSFKIFLYKFKFYMEKTAVRRH